MKAEIISIGTELLLGHVVNTNASYLAQRLAGVGINLYYVVTVGDNPSRLTETIERALGRSNIVITTGGLGPTIDDITTQTIKIGARHLLLKNFNKRRQAPFYQIRNKVGTAPGLIAKINDKTLIALPGPPRELGPMFENDILPYLKKRYRLGSIIKSRTIKITGLAESQINAKVKDLLGLKPPVTVGIYARLGEVDLKIMAKARSEKEAQKLIFPIEAKIRSRLAKYIFGYDDNTLESAVGKILTKEKLTIAAAESCTGGLITHRLTSVSGSSAYFIGGVVAYSNAVKERLLGVSPLTLKKYGAVSGRVAREMAKGVRLLLKTDIGIGVTGVAGPDGGTRSKPVGLVYAAIITDGKAIVRELHFKGSREEIKFQASQFALDMIRKICAYS